MINLFLYKNYKKYSLKRISSLPKNGRGEMGRISSYLGVHTSLISQIFKGDKNFTLEQGEALARYWSLLEVETQYWLNLISFERAGTKNLEAYYLKNLKQIKLSEQRLETQIKSDIKITEEDKSEFYSSWLYSLCRLASSIPQYQSVETLAEVCKLNIPETKVIIEFLLRTGLCKMEDGKIVMGPQTTFLGQDSPYLPRHHFNWRMYSIQRVQSISKDELMFTAPISTDEKSFSDIRKIFGQAIREIKDVVKDSDSKKLGYIGIDLLKIK